VESNAQRRGHLPRQYWHTEDERTVRQADMFNRWAEMNGSEPTYGIRPLKKATAEEELAHVDNIDALTDGNAIRTPYGLCSPGFNRDNPPW